MASDQESLRALEGLMTEFFGVQTTNERKRQIEELLNNFSQQKDAWKHCLFFMANTSNEYVMMYCMTVLENTAESIPREVVDLELAYMEDLIHNVYNLINKQWIGFQGQDKMEIRTMLNRFLMGHHDKVPTFVRNKLVKLVVDIGRLDWPHFYPDFFSNILQLVQQEDTAVLGLVMLQTTSEELACPREDLSMARKLELQKLLLAQVPTVLGIINGILESTLEKHRSLVTATPPPSPTHGQSADTPQRSPHASVSLFSSSPLQHGCILSNMFKSPSSRIHSESLPPLDSTSHHLSLLALNCLSHLFSWIPLSSTITPALLSTIFHFAAFGAEVSPNRSGSGSSGSFPVPSSGSQSLGVLAMCCVNELLAKNCVPQEFEDFLLQMFQQTFHLLQRLTKDSTTSASGNKLTDLDESYVEKFTEFLRLFVSIHLRRFESNEQFGVLEFLELLFKYTFKQPTFEGYFACLDIWGVFLDYLSTKLSTRNTEKDHILSRYRDALISLVTQVLQKFQFRYNQSQLDELDDDSLDDDSETEWQHFLRQNLEVVAKVVELMPQETCRYLFEPFQEYLDIYLGLEQYITNGPQGRRLNLTQENECRRLHCTLRDFSSLLQALGRLAEHFIGENFMERFSDANTLLDRLVHTCAYGTKMKLYEVKSMADNVLQGDFVEVHAQALAAVKAHACWMAQFYAESHQHEEQRQKCSTLITALVNSLVPLFDKQVPEKVIQSAAHLLLSVLTTVRASFLLQLPNIQTMYNKASQGSIGQLNTEVQLMVYRSLSHYLLLPWAMLSENEQQWSTRATNHRDFVKQLTAQFRQLKEVSSLAENKTLQDEAKPCVRKTLQVMTDLVESIGVDGVSKSKIICYQSLTEVIQVTLTLLPIYIHQPDVTDDILGFYLALYQGLRAQMGVQATEQTIQTFMSMFTREQLTETILHESNTGFRVVDKFLKLLELIVQEPGAAFKAFLPSVLSICMEQIYPIIAERPSADIKPTLYELLYQILCFNWRYFFKGTVFTSIQYHNDEMENQQQFISIMQAFGQSFLQPDIGIFRQNLEGLENLNLKWKLYHKKIFKEVMLYQFLNVLIQVLVHKSHDLLQEEIGITVYNMSSVNFDTFYSDFLPQFLANCEGLDENQKAILAHNFKLDKDLPSFTQSIHRFVNDLRYYRLCNSSLPEGSVKF